MWGVKITYTHASLVLMMALFFSFHGMLDITRGFICLIMYIKCIFFSLQVVSGLLDDLPQATFSTRLGL